MGGREALKEKIQNFLRSISGENSQSKKTVYIIITALVALFLIILGNSLTSNKNKSNQPDIQLPLEETSEETVKKDTLNEDKVDDLEASYEKDLKEMLE